MYIIMFMVLLSMIIPTLIMKITIFISKKKIEDREKSSPFECGFDPINSARLPFSLRFFLIAVIFLIFDVEITLLLPMTIILLFSNPKSWTLISMMFLIILLLGVYHEWNQGSLEWAH
nr:NADH dehydrogenase subunit 3 [Perisphaerus sp. 3 ZQW-2023b]